MEDHGENNWNAIPANNILTVNRLLRLINRVTFTESYDNQIQNYNI